MTELFRISMLALCLHLSSGKILRNNALMSKMVSEFHNPETPADPDKEPPQPKVLNLMQNVLCKNFPSIPCDLIMGDTTLKTLIERSIQQLKFKKRAMEKTTQPPGYQLTLFPIVNSEELSNYLSIRNPKTLHEEKPRQQMQKAATPKTTFWSADDNLKKPHKTYGSKRTAMIGHKNIRKFYPHKIKYKDKNGARKDFGDYSDDRLSMSVEIPDMTLTKKHQHYSYRREPDDPPVWRIDYMKHGEPSLNRFGYEADQLKGKLVKNSQNVVVDDNILDNVVRKDVLHPDVYIKKNTRNTAMDLNSDGMD